MTEGTALNIEAEANAAANDAARDARAEVFERSEKKTRSRKRKARTKADTDKPSKSSAKASMGNKKWHRFVVDIWLTDLNPTEFGVYKRSRNRAKSRQFTSDMDIYAEIIENGERTGLLGYREELWKKKSGMDKRLVFKLFTANLGWKATMDLMIGRSLQLTMGSRGLPVMVYSINTNDDDFIVYVERSANKWPLLPENFSFFLINDGKPEFYRLRRNYISIRGDYTLYDQNDNKIGKLNGKLLSIAGKWKGKVRVGHADKKLLTVLKLFGGTIIFNGSVRRHMRRLWRDMIEGNVKPKLERQESDLYMNPRRVR